MLWINLQYSPAPHELQTWSVSKGLSLHQPSQRLRMGSTICSLVFILNNENQFTNLSILADHPNLPETSTQGDELRRFETWTLATLSPSCCFIQSQRRLYSCFVSLSLTSSSSPGATAYLMRKNPRQKPQEESYMNREHYDCRPEKI